MANLKAPGVKLATIGDGGYRVATVADLTWSVSRV